MLALTEAYQNSMQGSLYKFTNPIKIKLSSHA